MRRITGLLAGLCCLTIARSSVAQLATPAADSSGSACVVLSGIRIGADWGDSLGAGRTDTSQGRGGFRLGGGTTIDTTFNFNISERRWSRPSLTAFVAGGVSGRTRNASASNDPRSRWHACVGVTLAMQRPTLVLRGVQGQVHFKVDLTQLTRIPGATIDSSRQNQPRR